MPELRIHTPIPELDTARLRPALRDRARHIANVRCIRCQKQASTSPCAYCASLEQEPERAA